MKQIPWKDLRHAITKFGEADFLASLTATRKNGLIIGYIFLAFVNPIYILIDRSMFPEHWQQWNFLGIRMTAALLGGLALLLRPLRESMTFFMIPFFILHGGITLMLITYPLDRWTEAYQGSALMVVGMSLISAFSLTQQILALAALYLFSYTIWLWNPPPSMEVWMTDGGFSNLNTSFVIAGAFYYLRLSYAYTIHQLHKEITVKNQQLEIQSRDVHSILRNIPEAVCIVTLDSNHSRLMIDPYSSDFLRRKSEKAEANSHEPFDFMLAQTDLAPDVQSTIRWILMAALKEDVVQWEMNQHLLPREFRYLNAGRWLIMEADWNVIADEQQKIQKILLTVRNVSDLRQWQADVREQQSEAQRILELLQSDGGALRRFFPAAYELLMGSKDSSDAALRNLHSLKGLSRTYRLSELVKTVHAREEHMIRSRQGQSTDLDLASSFEACRHCLGLYQQSFERIQDLGQESTRNPALASLAGPFIELTKAVSQGRLDESQRLLRAISEQFDQSFTELIREEHEALGPVARELGKAKPYLNLINGNLMIPLMAQLPLKTSLGHLLRNSMDHGLEQPEERQRNGKDQTGCIRIELQRIEPERLVILYQDDGRGLDLEAIRRKVPPDLAVSSDEQLADMIFQPGFSTAARTTDISGRGLGMDCVRDAMTILGGRVSLELKKPLPNGRRPFSIRMDFPL